jgi:hypothetical protein
LLGKYDFGANFLLSFNGSRVAENVPIVIIKPNTDGK